MKCLLLPLILLFGLFGVAQDCKNYLFLQSGKTIEMTIYSKKGDVNGKQIYTVSNYSGNENNASATITAEMFDKKGKTISTSTNQVQCAGGVMKMDLKMNLSGEQLKNMKADANAKSVYIDYPLNMKVGDVLTDGHMQADIDMNTGMKQSVTMDVTNRKVEGKESITTAAGTWECYKITSHMKTVVKMSGIGIPMNSDNIEWFAPGVGIIKTESKYGTTAITAIH